MVCAAPAGTVRGEDAVVVAEQQPAARRRRHRCVTGGVGTGVPRAAETVRTGTPGVAW